MALPPSYTDFQQSQIPMAKGTERHYMPKPADMSPLREDALQPRSQDWTLRSAMGSWTPSSEADAKINCQQLSYTNLSTVGMSQSYGLGSCEAPGQLLLEADGHPFDFSAAQLSGLPGMGPCANTSQLGPESRSLSGCRDSWGWVCNPASAVFGLEPDSSASPKPAGSSYQHSEEAVPSGLAPLSPAVSAPSNHSLQFNNSNSSPVKSPIGHDETRPSSGSEEEGSTDPPYSLLIYQALLSAHDKKLPLQGIYSWFEKNTEKGKDQSSRGWQNSIRHNLSMNAGFEAVKVEIPGAKRAVNFWRLTDEALKNGIQSTTRYRKQANYKKALSLEPPAAQRQRSGARGGKATKVTAKFHRTHHDELRRERHYRTRHTTHRQPEKQIYLESLPTGLPLGVPSLAAPTGHSVETFDLRHVVGCTDYSPSTPIFSDMDAAETGYFALDVGALGWCGMYSAAAGGFCASGPEAASDFDIGHWV